MAIAEASERSYYLDDFTDEVLPCATSLAGWAEWLSKPDEEWNRGGATPDGERFKASVTRWEPDIIAQRSDGEWAFSREPEEGYFLAVRFAEGLGWSPDNILWDEAGSAAALRAWFADPENDRDCEDTEYIAVGKKEPDVVLIYRANAPRLIVEGQVQ